MRILLLLAFTGLAIAVPASAQEKYPAPDLSEYYASLMQPDNPSISCCGEADSYHVRSVACTPAETLAGCFVAVEVIDTRPDLRKLPGGKIIRRPHLPVGTRFIVPENKRRLRPSANPDEHDIAFIGTGGHVLCYEPLPGI